MLKVTNTTFDKHFNITVYHSFFNIDHIRFMYIKKNLLMCFYSILCRLCFNEEEVAD